MVTNSGKNNTTISYLSSLFLDNKMFLQEDNYKIASFDKYLFSLNASITRQIINKTTMKLLTITENTDFCLECISRLCILSLMLRNQKQRHITCLPLPFPVLLFPFIFLLGWVYIHTLIPINSKPYIVSAMCFQ